ncbi:Rho GTPase-activating protein 23 [Bagarius yarrelli]|uniref:Rho GTPase-activating protein 23 n=1 Tax=Bagarius yarrelli TaxID=175774 RepID=A0A556TIR3_BAGYA|nr:Rho GTPase-activating protein 23 [Bagarius yarrelli]
MDKTPVVKIAVFTPALKAGMWAMRHSVSGVPAPAGKEWFFEFPVGVDCSDPEPRCIWLAALRNLNVQHGHVRFTRRNMLSWHLHRAKGPRDGVLLSNENARPVSREGVVWKGPRTVVLQKNSQGFGFTLRHFIVYPPESALHTSVKDVENGNGKGTHRGRLEPMDTIFVKSVKEMGPAHQAGLCTGDRLVKVNRESILGKTYSQVIALIKNSKSVLELSIMPKDEDVLQLAYSHDAYLKGNQPYTGGAQNLPEPPPVCYPRSKPTSSGMPANLNCRRGSAGLVDSRTMVDSTGGIGHHSDVPSRHVLRNQRARSSTIAISPLDFHFANHNAAITSASLPHPRKGSLPLSQSELCHQALAKWYHNQTTERPCMSYHHRSISQDTLLCHYETATGVNQSPYIDSCWMGRWGMIGAQQSNRSCSENLLAACVEYEKSNGRSLEKLDKAASLVSPRYEGSVRINEQPCLPNQRAVICADVPPPGRGFSQVQEQTGSQSYQSAQPRCLPTQTVDDQMVGYRSYSPSFCRKAGHLMQQAHSFRDSSYTGPHLSWTSTPKTSPPNSAPSSGRDSSPLSMSSTAEMQNSAKESSDSGPIIDEPQSQLQEVVLRQKPAFGKCTPHAMRHPNYAVPVDLLEPPVASAPARSSGNLKPLPVEQDSLASIPFIDEPTSPSIDLLAQHVPASSVVSSSSSHAPTLPTSPVPPSLTSPLTHLLDMDCSTVKNSRRSSYLLAITTERSRSCDEGLNTFRDEGRVFMRLPKRVKSFFTEGSLESLRAAEEARSKRHSTSELGNITLTDIRKEGWLHYKQILTEKGKKVGGGMRPWKRVFSVLRSHSLFLYKDKREAVLHGAGSLGHGGGGGGGGSGEDEQPISIRGCLIDIAYSETKRKHTLRLTTQDFCEYLLQAEDRDDMLSWIRIIRDNSKTDNEELGFSRQALINKKLNDYRKQSLTGTKPDTPPRVHRMMQPFLLSKTDSTSGVNRSLKTESKDESPPKATWSINIMKKGKKTGPKAFGVRLEDCPPGANNKFVPLIVETCCSLVEEMGLEYTGIYRVPGNNAMVSNLQDQLNKGMEINTAEEIHDLPDHCFHTLKFLICHLKRVADHSERNKMEPRNLALVFGPTLVRTSEDNMTDMVTHMPDRYKIVETLILHHAWFFSDGLMDKDEKTPEDQRDEQPIPNINHLLSNIGRTAALGDASDSTNSDSAKSKGSSNLKKDASSKDFLPLSIISAVTRKRKKHQSACSTDSSSDEDSEHEPVKSSNYGELSENKENERNEEHEKSKMGCAGQSTESQTTEEDEKDVEGKRMMESNVGLEQEVGLRESVGSQQEDNSIRVSINVRTQAGHEQPQRPRSFLYSQRNSPEPGLPDETSSPSSPCSSDAHILSQCNLASRKKLRGERARPRSLYEEPGLERAVGLARVKASLARGQERLRQAMSPSRDPSVQQSWLSQVQANILSSANDLWRSGTQRRHASPETRRRRRDWRRHTVVGNSVEG